MECVQINIQLLKVLQNMLNRQVFAFIRAKKCNSFLNFLKDGPLIQLLHTRIWSHSINGGLHNIITKFADQNIVKVDLLILKVIILKSLCQPSIWGAHEVD